MSAIVVSAVCLLGLGIAAAGGQVPIVTDAPVHARTELKRETLVAKQVIETEDDPRVVVLSPDGSRIAVAGRDRIVRLLDPASGKVVRNLAGQTGDIAHLAFSRDGSRLAAYSMDPGLLLVWTTADGEVAARRQYQDRFPTRRSFAFSPDGGSLLGIDYGMVTVLELKTGKTTERRNENLKLQPCDLRLTRDGKSLFAVDTNGTLLSWDLAGERLRFSISAHDDAGLTFAPTPISVSLSPDESLVLTRCDRSREARVWRAIDAKRLFTVNGQRGYGDIHGADFSPDGRHLVTVEFDQLVGLWSVPEGKLTAAFRAEGDWMRWVKYLPDGKTIVARQDKGFRFWDVSEALAKTVTDTVPPAELVPSSGVSYNETGTGTAARFSTDGRSWMIADRDGVEHYDLKTGERLQRWDTPDLPYLHAEAVAADSGLMFRYRAGVAAGIWNSRTGVRQCNLENPWLRSESAELSPDGALLAWLGREKPEGPLDFGVWDVKSGRRLWAIRDVEWANFSPDSRMLALGIGSEVSLRSAAGGAIVAKIANGYEKAAWASFSKDTVAVSAALPDANEKDSVVDFWSLSRKAFVKRLKTSKCAQVEFSGDGRFLAGSLPFDSSVRVWDAATLSVLCTLRVGDYSADQIRFSADGTFLAVKYRKTWGLYVVPAMSDRREVRATEGLKCRYTHFEKGRLVVNPEFSLLDEDLIHAANLSSPSAVQLAYCKNITDAGVRLLAGAKAIVELELPDSVTDRGLAAISKVKLRKLQVQGDRVTDAGMAAIADMTDLTELSLECEKLSAAALPHLKRLSNLRSLTLRFELADADIPALAPFGRLQRLSARCNLSDAGLAALAKLLPNLQTLSLGSESTVTDAGLAALARLTDLRDLSLSGCKLTDAALQHLARLEKLERLDISDNEKILGPGLRHLAGLKELTDLSFYRTGITGAGLEHLALPKLTTLSLTVMPVTDAGLAHIANLTQLKSLGLPTHVTDAALKHLARLENLETLSLRETAITGAGFAALGGLPSLKSIDLTSARVDDEGLRGIGRLIRLNQLDLDGTRVTDEGMAHLSSLSSLVNLHLENTNVTDAGLLKLRSIAGLRSVVPSSRITAALVEAVEKRTGAFVRQVRIVPLGEGRDAEALWFSKDGATVSAWRKSSINLIAAAPAPNAAVKTTKAEKGDELFSPKVAVSPDGALAAVLFGGQLRLYDTATGTLRTEVAGERESGGRPVFSPDGKRLMVVSGSRLQMVDVADGKVAREIPFALPFERKWAGYCRAGPVLVDEETVLIVDPDKPDSPRRLTGLRQNITGFAVSPDGSRIAALGSGDLMVWDAATGKPILSIPQMDGQMETLAFSPDGRRLAVRGALFSVHLVEIEGARRRMQFKGFENSLDAFAFSPDGSRLAVYEGSFRDSRIHIFDVDSLLPTLPAGARP